MKKAVPAKAFSLEQHDRDRVSALVRIYRAASMACDLPLEKEAAKQLAEEFGILVPHREKL